jgi:hypothetical protein
MQDINTHIMNFQQIIVEATIIDQNNNQTKTKVDVNILAGRFNIGSVIDELQRNHPNCKIIINDVLWVI